MIQVSDAVYSAIQAGAKFIEYATITLVDGTVFNLTPSDFTVTNNHIVDGAGESVLPLGAAIEKIIQLEIVNPNEQYNEYDFQGAVIELTLSTTIGTSVEDLPHGTYTVVEPAHYGDSLIITAVDDMYKADQLITGTITFPITLGSLASALCTACGITLASSTFTNSTNQVSSFAGDYHEYTYRQMFGFIAQFAGGNVRINYDNELEIVSYPFDEIANMSSAISRDLAVITDSFPLTITFEEDPLSFNDMSAMLYKIDGTTIKTWTWNTLETYIVDMVMVIPTDSTISAVTDGPLVFELKWLSAYNGIWHTYRVLIPILDRQTATLEVLDKWRTISVETDDIEITGIQTDLMSAQLADSDNSATETVLVGNEGYVLTVTNPFLNASNYSTKLASILSLFSGFKIRPFSGEHVANPIIEFMDPVYIVTNHSKVYASVITDLQYNVLGHTAISNSAEPKLRTGKVYSSQSNNAYLRAVENTEKQVRKVNNYFWHDAAGAHVSTVENDATTGPNVLIDSDSLDIRDGEETTASFGEQAVIGKSSGSQVIINDSAATFINDAQEQVGKYSFGGNSPQTHIQVQQWQSLSSSVHSVTLNVSDKIAVGDTIELYIDFVGHLVGSARSIYKNTVTTTFTAQTIDITTPSGDEPLNSIVINTTTKTITVNWLETFQSVNITLRLQAEISTVNPSSIAIGKNCEATEDGSIAIGYNTLADEINALAEGENTYAHGEASHAEGQETEASAQAAHSEGFLTEASGDYSHAQNMGTVAASEAQTAMGKYNVADGNDTYALIIGNGSDDNNRSNALTVDWDGNLKCNNIGAVVSADSTVDVALANSTYTTILSVILSPGIWIIIARCHFTQNTSGVRRLYLSTTSSGTGWDVSYPAGSDMLKYEANRIMVLSAQTTIYLRAWQNSGSSLTCQSGRCGIEAIRIK